MGLDGLSDRRKKLRKPDPRAAGSFSRSNHVFARIYEPLMDSFFLFMNNNKTLDGLGIGAL